MLIAAEATLDGLKRVNVSYRPSMLPTEKCGTDMGPGQYGHRERSVSESKSYDMVPEDMVPEHTERKKQEK